MRMRIFKMLHFYIPSRGVFKSLHSATPFRIVPFSGKCKFPLSCRTTTTPQHFPQKHCHVSRSVLWCLDKLAASLLHSLLRILTYMHFSLFLSNCFSFALHVESKLWLKVLRGEEYLYKNFKCDSCRPCRPIKNSCQSGWPIVGPIVRWCE